jgi:hypothetical protein
MELKRDVPEGPRRSGAAALVVVALLGGVVGALLVRFTESRSGAEAPAADLASAATPIVHELQALKAELAALRSELAQSAAAPDAVPDAPSPLQPDVDAADALRAVADAVARLSALVEGDGGGSPNAALLVTPVQPAQRDRLAKLMGQDADARRQHHLLWTSQDVLDAYGRPDSIEVADGIERWSWQPATGQTISISFHEGRVFHVWQY